MRIRLIALSLLAVSAIIGCGDNPGPGEQSKAGTKSAGSITLNVDGKSYEFKEAQPWAFRKAGADVYWLETSSHDPEINTLVLYFETATTAPEGLAGELFFNPDYSAENPEKARRSPDFVINRFRAGGKWYQGYKMAGQVTAASNESATVQINSTFLEFDYDEPGLDLQGNIKNAPPGREVQVTGTVTLPWKGSSKE